MKREAEIRELLSGSVFLASDIAKRLIDRGFGEYLGVDVRPWNGKGVSGEMFMTGSVKGNTTKAQVAYRELVPLSDKVEADSVVYHAVGKAPKEELFPGVTVFKNELGGTVVTFCGTPLAQYNLVEAFSFLNYSRKQQLTALIKKLCDAPVYFPGDEEMYMRLADMPDGGLFVSLINIITDPIEEIELVCDRKLTRVMKLEKDGSRVEVDFRQDGAALTVMTECNPLTPVILFLY